MTSFERPMSVDIKKATQVADQALKRRLSYASLHWNTEKVDSSAWPHLIDAVIQALDSHGLLRPEPTDLGGAGA